MRPKTKDGVTTAEFNGQDCTLCDRMINLLVQFRICEPESADANDAGMFETFLRKFLARGLNQIAAAEAKKKPAKPGK